MSIYLTANDAFWPRVTKTDSCWLWNGYVNRGRPIFIVGTRRVFAPRIAWESVHGPLGRGRHLRHECGNELCVRPDHLVLAVDPYSLATRERFWSKVDRSGNCWRWTGSHNEDGYGEFGIGYKVFKASRVSWELSHGPIPTGLHVLHTCDNPACVTPNHLFLGTHQDNMEDMARKRRRACGERVFTAKLTPDLVREIRAKYRAGGISQAALGGQYGLHSSSICNVVTGKSWGHVTDAFNSEVIS